MNPYISIVIPVYNTGAILNDTIKSILNQTFSDFELLLIDDGSTDGSSTLCDNYQETDSRIRVFHKKNSGICSTRNFALNHIKGKYTTFCDHDDLYAHDFLEKMIQAAESSNSDIVKCGVKIDFADKNESYDIRLTNKKITYLQKELPIHFLDLIAKEAFEAIWNSLFKTEVLKNNNILYDEKYKHGGEDFDFNIKIYNILTSLTIIPDILYTHIIRTSLSTSAQLYDDILFNFPKQLNQINEYVKQHSLLCFSNNISFQYLSVYMRRVTAFIVYAAKMQKNLDEIKHGLETLHNNCLIKTQLISIQYLSKRKEKRSLLYYILFYLLKYRKLQQLYSIIKFMYGFKH